MEQFAQGWNGSVTCLLPLRSEGDAFSETFDIDQLPFRLRHFALDKGIVAEHLADADIVLASSDFHECHGLTALVHKAGKKIVYVLELTPETRRQILKLDLGRSWLQNFKSAVWLERNERVRKRDLSVADGVQVNGYPAYEYYSHLNRNTLLYLDNRITADLLARPEDIAARRLRLDGGAPLQIIHSGRLERIKGSHDLVTVARGLRDRGIRFDLHIFGVGSLEDELAREAEAKGLSQVHLHGPVDFADELVPFCRAHGDIFLSLHLQSDPSCTYLESFGCGLPIIGYSNKMWASLQRESGAGWVVPMGNSEAIAERLASLNSARAEVVEASEKAIAFAGEHLFENEFSRRLEHLRRVAETTRE